MVFFFVFDLDNTLAPTDEILKSPMGQTFTIDDYDQLFLPNPLLKAALLSLPGPKFIASNGTTSHVHHVLKAMKIDDCFQGAQSRREDTEPSCLKPFPKFYMDLLMHLHDFAKKNHLNFNEVQIVYFDDILENLIVPRKFGWITVHISSAPPVSRHNAEIVSPQFSFVSVETALQRMFPFISENMHASSPFL